MAHIVLPDVVFYACTCGLLKPISKLYFCRHCLQVRCGYCVCHEVDSHFCGKCAENIPSSEARLKKNRCSSCYDCPCCQHQLSTRVASSGQRSTTDPKATPKKVYYLACLFCRWNSRDVGIPDQPVVSGGWPERENPNAHRLTAVQDKYKAVISWEKQQKQDKEKKKRGKYLTLTDKTGLTAAMVRKRVGLPELPQSLSKSNNADLSPAEAAEQAEELDPDVFTKAVNLTEVTTLEQRLLQPEWQPATVDLLFPIHKHLSVKRSLRCRSCEHNVSKPEYNPNSIKFKIQLFAYYHIPEVRMVTAEPLRAGKVCEVIIKLCNPTQYETTVSLLQQPDGTDETLSETEEGGESAAVKEPSITVEPRKLDAKANATAELPAPIILPPRDDAAEYDDSGDTHNYHDDPKVVVWRKSNKVALKLKATPEADLQIGDEVVLGFVMQHVYVNTITTGENKEPQKCQHRAKVFLKLGSIVGSD